jgi:alpha-L-fucosidase
MKAVGIDTAIIIRCGVKKKLLYPSEYLMKNAGCERPRRDKLQLFFKLAEKYGIKLWIGGYYSGNDWMLATYDLQKEIELMKRSFAEIWENYAKKAALRS